MVRRCEMAVFGSVLAVLAGCAPPADHAVSQPPAATAQAASSIEAQPAAEPPAESGLAIKRGLVTLARDRATFRPCDEAVELWLLDQTDGVLAQAFAAELRNGPATLYVEAYGERAPPAGDIAAARSYAGSFVLEEVLYAGMRGEVASCPAQNTSAIVIARGAEPAWSVDISDSAVTWRQADAPQELRLPPAETEDAEGAVRYLASDAQHRLELLVDAGPCRDPLSGEFFAYAARALFDGREFSGCARVGR